MNTRPTLRILMIGNSHTYYNDLPLLLRRCAEAAGYACTVTMLAHGGWFLSQHAQEPEVRFNLLHGGYDYVVLQEHAHPFGPEEQLQEALGQLNGLIRAGGAKPVLYACWAKRDEPDKQPAMDAAHRRAAAGIGALLAPVGEQWWAYLRAHPQENLYGPDGAHASPAGSALAASCIWATIRGDLADGEEHR